MKTRIKGTLTLAFGRTKRQEPEPEPECETCSDEGKVYVGQRWSGEAYGELVEQPCPDCQ